MAFAWPRTQPEPEEPANACRAFKSPGLRLLAEKLSSPGKHYVLDLGMPRGDNVDFFSQFKCRLHVEDVFRELSHFPRALSVEDDPAEIAARQSAAGEELLVCDNSIQFDVIMGWDLFNYLEPDAITALMNQVSARSRPGTLFFLLVSTNSTISAEPSRVVARDDGTISYEPTTESMSDCPAYPPLSLEKMMPGFHLLHSFLLGDRMQDYLFSYR